MRSDTPTAPNPYDFHRRPRGSIYKRLCPICGYAGAHGEHRAVAESEGLDARWITRRDGNTAHLCYVGSRTPARKLAKPVKPVRIATVRPSGPDEKTRDRIRTAASMAASGIRYVDVARDIGVSLATLDHWRDSYAAIWNDQYDLAMKTVLAVVRNLAGSNAILDDPDRFVRGAIKCDVWARSKGIEVFSRGEKPTLCSFFDGYYVPVRLNDSPPVTIVTYRSTFRLWALVTADPPLEQITPETLATFKAVIEKTRGKDGIHWLATHTVRKHLRTIQCVLDKAGPPGHRNRDAKGILATTPPWIKPPRADDPEPRSIPLQSLDAVYQSAVSMDWPHNSGIKAPEWWRALLAVAYNTSLRHRSLFELKMSEVDWQNRRLVLPPQRLKSRKRMIVPLNDVAYEHLIKIRAARELVFPRPGCVQTFYRRFKHLQELAGIPEKEKFGLQEIRETGATILWEDSPQAAQYALGHSSSEVTRRFYVAGTGLVARARAAMPQPASFRSPPGGTGEQATADGMNGGRQP